MEGEHLLDGKGLVQVVINNADNLTLRGERDHSNTDSTIKCNSKTHGLVFNNSNIINIYGITITECGQQDTVPLSFINVISLYIHHITLCNNTYNTSNYNYYGGILYIYCATDTLIAITDSTFTNNIIGESGHGLFITSDNGIQITITNTVFTNTIIGGDGGGACIVLFTDAYSDIVVTNSMFTNNIVGGDGGGLLIADSNYNDSNITITCTSSIFTSNIVGGYGGGLCINSGADTNILITNSVFSNNIVGKYGGGMHITYYNNNIHNTLIITDSTIMNNTIGNDGGGLYIESDYDVQIKITITNSIFINIHVVGDNGGGLYIYNANDHEHDITITNSMFTNNIVGKRGGGIYVDSTYGNILLTINNNTFTNNTAGNNGGGLLIYSETEIHVIIANSTITNNIAGGMGGGLFIECYTGVWLMSTINILTSKLANHNGSGLLLCSAHHEVKLSQVDISNNSLSGIMASDYVTVVFTEGHSFIANNSSPTDGAGIHLGKNSYLTSSNRGHVSFVNNTAYRYGGAIFRADDDYILLGSNTNIHSEQCIAYNLSATFINNSAANAGDTIYGGTSIYFWESWVNEHYSQLLLQCTGINPTASLSELCGVFILDIQITPFAAHFTTLLR